MTHYILKKEFGRVSKDQGKSKQLHQLVLYCISLDAEKKN